MTLDWLLESQPAPRVVKIDVEGAELEVLNGGRRLFETVRPVVLCEVIPSSERAVTRFLESRDYQIFDGETPAQTDCRCQWPRGAPWRFRREPRRGGFGRRAARCQIFEPLAQPARESHTCK